MADVLSMQYIEKEYEKAKGNLENINESLKKFTYNSNNKRFVRDNKAKDQIVINNDDTISDDDQQLNDKLVLSSSIVQLKPKISREDLMVRQKNQILVDRNKRMFGHLLGTLNQFKKESDQAKPKIMMRQEIEKKLEDKANQEKQELIQEKRELFTQQKSAKNKMKALEIKIEILKMQESWESYQNKLKNFIKTDTYPPIYYVPSLLDADLQKKIDETASQIEQDILDRRELIENEIKKLDDPTFFQDPKLMGITNTQNHTMNGNDHINSNDTLLEDVFDEDATHCDKEMIKSVIVNTSRAQQSNNRQHTSTNSENTHQENNTNNTTSTPRIINLSYNIFQFKRNLERKIKVHEMKKVSRRQDYTTLMTDESTEKAEPSSSKRIKSDHNSTNTLDNINNDNGKNASSLAKMDKMLDDDMGVNETTSVFPAFSDM